MFEARHLRVLRAVARTGSLSGAARELGCTQPAVSQQMKALELAAGTPLLVRGGRTTRLTEAGEALARHASGILAGLAAAEEEVAAIGGLRAGRVRLVSFPSAGPSLVPTALAAMRAAHPDVRITLAEAQPRRAVEMLRAGECELALAYRYEDEDGGEQAAAWEGLLVRPLLFDRLFAVLPAGHRPARGGGPVRLSDLADEPWIAGCPHCRRHLVELCRREGFEPRIDFATDDYPAAVGLVASGMGVPAQPGLALEAVRLRAVAVRELRPAVRREAAAVTLPDLAQVPAVDMMLGRLRLAALRDRPSVRVRAEADVRRCGETFPLWLLSGESVTAGGVRAHDPVAGPAHHLLALVLGESAPDPVGFADRQSVRRALGADGAAHAHLLRRRLTRAPGSTALSLGVEEQGAVDTAAGGDELPVPEVGVRAREAGEVCHCSSPREVGCRDTVQARSSGRVLSTLHLLSK